jgi:acetyl-CoA carboxylase biotin carboxylase subunit
MKKIRRVLIANRGEIALRIVRSLRVLGIESVVAHSSVDASSLAVRSADQGVLLGPAFPAESYLSVATIVDAARRTSCDAIHPGYGFLSERAEFAQAVEDVGLIYIGPTPENVSCLGDKQAARDVLEKSGVPPIPGGTLVGGKDVKQLTAKTGFPLLLKATAGGGGRGIRVVRSPGDLADALSAARSEAEAAFGTTSIIAERYLEGARHIEVQVLGDGVGGVRVFCERDCSTQRRLQKILEETPSPAVDASLRERLLRTAASATAKARYRGAGTIEFILSAEGELFFLEMNTRIQVEHPITEVISGVDLVAEQIAIAEGIRLPPHTTKLESHAMPWQGAAMEFRVNAEDPVAHFRPEVGTLRRVRLPGGPGLRVDTAVEAGSEITPHYDSLLAKIIASGVDREQARCRLEGALVESRFDGIATTLPLGLTVLRDPSFRAGAFHCQSLEAQLAADDFFPPPLSTPESALAAAAAAWFRARELREHRSVSPTASVDSGAWQALSAWGDAP